MANEITFDKLPQAVGYLTEQVERIHKIVAVLQPQTAIDKHRIVEIDEACQITRKAKPTTYTLARKGLIPAYKRGKKLYFYEDELLQWIESSRKTLLDLNLKELSGEVVLHVIKAIHLCTEDDDYKYCHTLPSYIEHSFMGHHCNYGAPLKDVDV